MRLKRVNEKQPGHVGNWMKVIFTDESIICIGQSDDARTFVRYRSNETYGEDYLE